MGEEKGGRNKVDSEAKKKKEERPGRKERRRGEGGRRTERKLLCSCRRNSWAPGLSSIASWVSMPSRLFVVSIIPPHNPFHWLSP